ncbi:hypothetical protein SLITO_v1c08150 [Spiroplasma litorale]|uniref:Uncharacterized protein n=1 Tax=Spiroplasma litorale TaxID=216942 RepID=A0A0K1W278_9MOLU|nr:hypothetical protein [Spiroplasma litorale]AKX34434.1 hypothetical protein SLITO_v1c08150 [Spiroplasma litorale]
MNKKINVKFLILNILIINIFLLFSLNIKNDFYNTNTNYAVNDNKEETMWSGLSLQYFLYKHTNIKENQYINDLANGVIEKSDNSEKTDYEKSKDLFYMYLSSSIFTTSIYGTNSYKEFFAEAYSKWQTTNDSMKNKSWEILNYYFLNIYNKLKINYTGSMYESDWNNIKTLIDEDFVDNSNKNNLIYNTNLENKTNDLTYKDLLYDNENFGMNDFKINTKQYSFAYNLLYASIRSWSFNIAIKNIPNFSQIDYTYRPQSFSTKSVKTLASFFNKNTLEESELSKLNNDIYTKASNESITKFNNIKNDSNNVYFKSFNELNNFFVEQTKIDKANYSNINFKETIYQIKNYYKWDSDKVDIFKKQILDMINLSLYITKTHDKYYLLTYIYGIIISPDYPLKGNQEGVMAYAANAFTTYNQKKSSKYSYIVYTGLSLDQYKTENDNDQYKKTWWSSPNIFATLNHEMGHVIDGFLNLDNSLAKMNEKKFKNDIQSKPLKSLYSGEIFGTNSKEENNKDEESKEKKEDKGDYTYLIVVFTILGLAIIVIIIWVFYYKKNKKNKNKL